MPETSPVMTWLNFAAVVLAGITYGWLWADPSAHFLDPIKGPLNRWLMAGFDTVVDAGSDVERLAARFSSLRREGPFWDYVRKRLGCPVCMGFDASFLVTVYFVRAWSWELLIWPAAAAGVHVVWVKLLNHLEGP